ncbi:MAG: hypothetical protein ACO38P_11560, partial [Phycisphaerales bacterium]
MTNAAPRSAIVIAAALATAILLFSAGPVLVSLVLALATGDASPTDAVAGGADPLAAVWRTIG